MGKKSLLRLAFMATQKHNFGIFFLIVLLLGFFVRLSRFDFPLSYTFFWGDGTRDFLVASHILKYQEIPLLGPFNLLNEAGIHNSPIYFYLLSLFLLPLNNILTLSLVNILLQIGVIVLIYVLVRKLFDYPTAIIAVLLFSFNPEVIKQADFIWQPYLMLFFALLALYLKLKSRDFISLATLCFAATLHNSAFCWLPIFLLSYKKSAKYYFVNFTIICLVLVILYSPLLIFYLQNGFPGFSLSIPVFVNAFSVYFSNLWLNSQALLKVFYLNNIMILILVMGFFAALKKDLRKRKELLFILILLILPIFFASFFNKIRLHYVLLSLVLLPILVAKITAIFNPLLRFIVVLFFLIILSGNFAYYHEAKFPLVNQQKMNNLTQQVINELNQVKQIEGFSDYNFFQVVSFSKSQIVLPYPVLDTVLLVSLEDRLSKKLTQVSDISPYNHVQINRKDFYLISCFGFDNDEQGCQEHFKNNFPGYSISKMIYNDDQSISIYLAKHEQI